MSLSAAIFGEDSTVWKIGNILGLGIPKLLNNLIATESMERAIGEIEKVTASEGGWRTIVWGRVRPIGGNTIFTGPPISYWMEETNEGKGASDDQSTSVEHIFRSYAIGICEGPITKVTRVWRNNKLVYDARGTAWGIFNNPAFLRIASFHLGTFEQDPSWVLQVFLGADNVPAFRGTAYMVVNFEDLTDMAGSIPQYQFEVEREPPPSPPSYSPLVAKLIDLGADEVWKFDDASSGAAALYDSDNDLVPTDGSDNFVYEHPFSVFPESYGIDASDLSGDKTYLSTTSPATGLHTLGAASQVFIYSPVASYNPSNPTAGLASVGATKADNNIFCHSARVSGELNSSYNYRHQDDSIFDQGYSTGINSSLGSDALVIATRAANGIDINHYLNGQNIGIGTMLGAPTGGANCKYLVGRDTFNLSLADRPPHIYGTRAWFKTELTAADVKQLMDSAVKFSERVGAVPDSYVNRASWSGKIPLDGVCMVYSRSNSYNETIINPMADGEIAYVLQAGTGVFSYSATSGGTLTGDTTTVSKGDILKIEKTGNYTFVGTLYPSETA